MTVENWLSQIGVGSKQLNERYAEYPAAGHDQNLYYAYEPSLPSHGHVAASKHHYSGGGHKSHGAMSALTLLAFLFFLHILQQCLKEHMTAMSTPQIMVVSAGREGEQGFAKIDKMDKAGVAQTDKTHNVNLDIHIKNKNKLINDDTATSFANDSNENFLMKIQTTEHVPQNKNQNYDNASTNYTNTSAVFSGFVSAMKEKF